MSISTPSQITVDCKSVQEGGTLETGRVQEFFPVEKNNIIYHKMLCVFGQR